LGERRVSKIISHQKEAGGIEQKRLQTFDRGGGDKATGPARGAAAETECEKKEDRRRIQDGKQ